MPDALLVECERCGATNRIAPEKLEAGRQPVCGRCKNPLRAGADSGPVEVTDATFARQVERSPVPVLVDMWAPWCGPCRFLSPIVEDLARQMAGRLRVAKVNIDQNPAVSSRFNIQSIPALLLFKEGREIDRIIGAQPKSEILRRLERFI
jgi:thioredoxin 2